MGEEVSEAPNFFGFFRAREGNGGLTMNKEKIEKFLPRARGKWAGDPRSWAPAGVSSARAREMGFERLCKIFGDGFFRAREGNGGEGNPIAIDDLFLPRARGKWVLISYLTILSLVSSARAREMGRKNVKLSLAMGFFRAREGNGEALCLIALRYQFLSRARGKWGGKHHQAVFYLVSFAHAREMGGIIRLLF